MNVVEYFRKYKFVIKRELDDGSISTVIEKKFSIFTCNTTNIPQLGMLVQWKMPSGELMSGRITDIEQPLHQPRYLRIQIDDEEVINISMNDYDYARKCLSQSDNEDDKKLATKHISKITVSEWFKIRDYNTSKERYERNMGVGFEETKEYKDGMIGKNQLPPM